MAASPLVYIVVLSWNGKRDTLECIRSLSTISYPNYRILVVDNASSDGTAETVRRNFPGVEILVNETNLRFAGGNNTGIKYSLDRNADYVLLLNNDTVVDKDFLTILVASGEADSRIGMIGPKIYFQSDPRRIWYAGGRIEWWKGWISHVGIYEIEHGQYVAECETDYITGCCLLVKRTVVEKIGILDESYYIYGEDADWNIRAARAGYKLMFVPTALIWHKLSVSSGGHLSWFKNWNKLKSHLRLMIRYARWYHWLTMPVCFVILVVINLIRGFFKFRINSML